MNWRIEVAQKKHIPQLKRLYLVFAEDEYACYKQDASRLCPPRKRWEKILRLFDEFNHPLRKWLVALDGEKVIGSAILSVYARSFFEKEFGRIDLVVTDRPYRRKGIARALIEKAQEMAEEMGLTQTLLEALDCNESAMRLYESMGYESFSRTMVKLK